MDEKVIRIVGVERSPEKVISLYSVERSPEELLEYQIAIHEAGHAVVACVLGLAPNMVTIVPKGDLAGYSEQPGVGMYYTTATAGELNSIARDQVVVCMAGGAAEDEFLFWKPLPNCRLGDEEDVDKLFSEYRIRPGKRRLREQARSLVRQHHDSIKRIAELLIERRTMTGAEIVAAMAGVEE